MLGISKAGRESQSRRRRNLQRYKLPLYHMSTKLEDAQIAKRLPIKAIPIRTAVVEHDGV